MNIKKWVDIKHKKKQKPPDEGMKSWSKEMTPAEQLAMANFTINMGDLEPHVVTEVTFEGEPDQQDELDQQEPPEEIPIDQMPMEGDTLLDVNEELKVFTLYTLAGEFSFEGYRMQIIHSRGTWAGHEPVQAFKKVPGGEDIPVELFLDEVVAFAEAEDVPDPGDVK